ncbi:hypothetical protein [Tabrizicola sp.]|uniref:hypothetical protein n=1 Tax=Tabrizicola sp. TaxID=2005166 RepID=UPI003F3611D3
MPGYLCPCISGASMFVTATLADRRVQTQPDQMDGLRDAGRMTRADHPFRIDAWMVLPDHVHAVWTPACGIVVLHRQALRPDMQQGGGGLPTLPTGPLDFGAVLPQTVPCRASGTRPAFGLR